MAHLPKVTLLQLISQRHRVLRGRDLTIWERFKDRCPYIDVGDVFMVLVMIFVLGDLALLGFILLAQIRG